MIQIIDIMNNIDIMDIMNIRNITAWMAMAGTVVVYNFWLFGIGVSIHTRREIRCLPYVEFCKLDPI